MATIDIIILIIIGAGAIVGFMKGFIRQLASILGLIVGLLAAKALYTTLAEKLCPTVTDSMTVAQVLAFIIIWIAVPLIFLLVASLLTKAMKAVSLDWLNRWLGCVLGALKFLLLTSLVICLIEFMDGDNKLISATKKSESLLYYPMETFLSRYTDQQICINREDYELAKRKFHAKYVDYVPGVGIDRSQFRLPGDKERQRKRERLGVRPDQVVLLTSGEMIPRKNQEVLFRMLTRMKDEPDRSAYEKLHLLLCGHGELNEHLHGLADRLGIADHISFLGYREDMLEIFGASDIFLFPSFQEGLPRAMLEAMASGLPVICSEIRGNTDLMGDSWTLSADRKRKLCPGGIMLSQLQDADVWAEALEDMLSRKNCWKEMGEACIQRSQEFSLDTVEKKMREIYGRFAEME